MATIAGIRQQYPQYNDLSDQQLADKMYVAHYSDMPRTEFNQKIGLNAQPGPQPTVGDQIIASPLGRLFHDAVARPITSLEMMLGSGGNLIDPNVSIGQALATPANTFLGKLEQADAKQGEDAYQASLAANRNTPGYAPALRNAQAVQAAAPSLSGFQAQATAPFNPGMAGLLGLVTGGIDQANANADVQAQAQAAYQKQHPILSAASQMIGGLGARPNLPGLLQPMPAASVAPTIDQLGAEKQALYNMADRAGVVIDPQSFQKFATDLGTDLTKNNVVQADLHPKALAALSAVQDEAATGAPLTLARADAIRQAVNGAAEQATSSDARLVGKVKSALDSYLDGLGPEDVLSGDPATAVSILKDARGVAQREFKAKQIQQLIDLAQNQTANGTTPLSQAIHNQFKNYTAQLIKDPSLASTWTPEEREAITQVSKGGTGENILRWLGKLDPRGIVSGSLGPSLGAGVGGTVGGPVGAIVGAATAPAVGRAAQAGANALASAAAQRAMDIAALGPRQAPMLINSAPMFQAPQITSASRLPLGLLGSGLLAQAQPAQ